MVEINRVKIYGSRWLETAGLIGLVLLTVFKENAILDPTSRTHDLFDLVYFPVFAVMFVWFVLVSICGAILHSDKEKKDERIEFLGWLLINVCALFAMTVYVLWHSS